MCQKFWHVHVNESKTKSFFFFNIFFPSSGNLTFEEENVIFQNIFSYFNLFNWIVVNFLKNSLCTWISERSYEQNLQKTNYN